MDKVWILRFSTDGVYETCYTGYFAVFSNLDKAMDYIKNMIENELNLSYNQAFVGYEKEEDYVYGAIFKNDEPITEFFIELEKVL